MKSMLVLFTLLFLSGCATVSEYGQGCRDAMNNAFMFDFKGQTDEYCNFLEKRRDQGPPQAVELFRKNDG